MKHHKIFIGCIYLPPEKRYEPELVSLHSKCIDHIYSQAGPNDTIIIAGDYNQANLIWSPLPRYRTFADPIQSYSRSANERTVHELLLDGAARCNLYQINRVLNARGRMLDLIFVNEEADHTAVATADEPLVPLDNHHPALSFEVVCSTTETQAQQFDQQLLNYHMIDFEGLQHSISSTDWTSVLESTNVDIAASNFSAILGRLLTNHTPHLRPARKPAWSNGLLRRLKRNRNAASRILALMRNVTTKTAFNRASSAYKRYNRQRYASYVRKTQTNLRRNPSKFWSFVKTKYKESGLPFTMTLDNSIASSDTGKCELFARHFASVFRQPSMVNMTTQFLAFVPRNVVDVDTFIVTADMLSKAVRKLKSSYSPGPDGIPSVVMKRCAEQLAGPLLWIFNLSLSQAAFPAVWKRTIMFPIYKKGPKRFIANYRGITSLSSGSKLLELIVSNAIQFDCRNYISTYQHGFTPGRSVTTNLLEFTSFCFDNIAAGRQVDAIYTDLKSAFDRIDHNTVLQKFAKLGFSPRICEWLKSYLTDRVIQVKIGTSLSHEFSNGSGVAQGSNLGPLVYTIFSNDANLLFDGPFKLSYADDFKIFASIDNLADCYVLQSRIDKFAEWCDMNKMELSIEKCLAISFHRKRHREVFSYNYSISNHILERTDHVKDLGVLLDTDLSFRLHQSAIIDKANRQLGFMFKVAQEFDDPLCLRSLYCALVRSHLETAAVIWSPYHRNVIDRVERIQRKFVWFAGRNLPWRNPNNLPRYEARCNLLGLETLENRRFAAKAVLAAKILSSEVDCPNLLQQLNASVLPRRLRQRPGFLSELPARTVYLLNSPLRSISAAFNEVYHLYDFHVPTSRFREKIRQEMIDRSRQRTLPDRRNNADRSSGSSRHRGNIRRT